ncbi:hypothetical protein J4225_03930 [Candidatus Pacearchaeota archaeon]|nr:hypothetical protein [Candidatus Pacearchaeota archaeon]
MKHNIKVTLILLAMFMITQLIGIYVVNYYSPVKIIDGQVTKVSAPGIPYGMQPPEIKEPTEYFQMMVSIFVAFAIAIALIFFLMKFGVEFILKLWFFVVIVIALGIAFNSFIPQFKFASAIVSLIALPLAYIKIYKPNFYVHNLTELVIYPGIAAVFVPLLNIWTIIALLFVISIYDMWAVWHSGIMQKMAKYQINKLNIFSGFFVPYIGKRIRAKLKKLSKAKLKKAKIKVNVAILGGGDVIFPIIAAGVMLKTIGYISVGSIILPIASFFIILGAGLGLGYLFFAAEKKKFYPAMPFITAGILLGMLVYWLVF